MTSSPSDRTVVRSVHIAEALDLVYGRKYPDTPEAVDLLTVDAARTGVAPRHWESVMPVAQYLAVWYEAHAWDRARDRAMHQFHVRFNLGMENAGDRIYATDLEHAWSRARRLWGDYSIRAIECDARGYGPCWGCLHQAQRTIVAERDALTYAGVSVDAYHEDPTMTMRMGQGAFRTDSGPSEQQMTDWAIHNDHAEGQVIEYDR